jgi:hypothetical protein
MSAAFDAAPDRWKPLLIAAAPAYDPSKQKLASGYVIEAARVLKNWTVIPLTSSELEEKDAAAQLTQIQSVVADMKSGTGTTTVRLQRVERALAQLIKRLALKGVLP